MTKANIDVQELISSIQVNTNFKDLNWKGSFNDYVNFVRDRPEITRTAFQRVYDMIMSYGTTEYTEFKKKINHYKFFDDEHDIKTALNNGLMKHKFNMHSLILKHLIINIQTSEKTFL